MKYHLTSLLAIVVALALYNISHIAACFAAFLHLPFANHLAIPEIPGSFRFSPESKSFSNKFNPSSICNQDKPTNMTTLRAIRQVFLAIEQSEGAGARVRRSIGTPKLRNFSPFLMLDHFSISPGAGFPDHPHRM